jgi:sugar lactone lactonase YvrE
MAVTCVLLCAAAALREGRAQQAAPQPPRGLVAEIRAWADSAEGARQAGDWARYARFTDSVYARLGSYPNIIWAQARGAARLGDSARVRDRVTAFAAMGVYRDVDADSAFLPYRERPWFEAAVKRIRAANAAAPRARVRTTLADSLFVPEGIAVDRRDGSVLVSSIHRGQVARVASDGALHVLIDLADQRLGAAFGIAVDQERRLVYVGAQQIPHAVGYVAGDSGRTAVGVYELDTGKPVARLNAPADGEPHTFGDLAVASDGTLWVSDADAGGLFTAAPGARELTRVELSEGLASPQGVTPDASGRAVYVADYLLGIVRVERNGRVAVLARSDSVAVAAVDGLTRVGRTLIGVQNGFVPKRVVAYDLDESGERIVRSRTLEASREVIGGETTHVVPFGEGVLFLANTGWDAFNANGTRKPAVALTPARIAEVHVKP